LEHLGANGHARDDALLARLHYLDAERGKRRDVMVAPGIMKWFYRRPRPAQRGAGGV
jgi:hypothetical protein